MALDSIASLALWVAFACMFSSFIYFYCLFRKATPGKRIFHVMTTAVVGFAATSYFFMALGMLRSLLLKMLCTGNDTSHFSFNDNLVVEPNLIKLMSHITSSSSAFSLPSFEIITFRSGLY